MRMNSKNFTVFLFTSVLMIILLLPTQARAEDWHRWASGHGAVSGRGRTCRFAPIEMDVPEIMTIGEVYRWTIKTHFVEQPPVPVKVRVLWLCDENYSLLGDRAMDFILGPDDSLEAAATVEVRGENFGTMVACMVFVERPYRDEHLNLVSKDYWFPAGHFQGMWRRNPLNPRELVSTPLYHKIKSQAKRNFGEELQAAGEGMRDVPAQAKAIIDTLVPTLDESGRRKLAFVAENLSERTEGSLGEAANFIGRHAREWGGAHDCGSIEKAVDKVILLMEYNTLGTLFSDALKSQVTPEGRIWQYVHEALEGRREWVDVEEKLEALLKENPGDEDLLRHEPEIRSLIKEQPGGRQGSMDQ